MFVPEQSSEVRGTLYHWVEEAPAKAVRQNGRLLRFDLQVVL